MYKFVSKLVAWYDYLVLFRTFKICFRPSGRPACTLFIFIKTFYAYYFYFLMLYPFHSEEGMFVETSSLDPSHRHAT